MKKWIFLFFAIILYANNTIVFNMPDIFDENDKNTSIESNLSQKTNSTKPTIIETISLDDNIISQSNNLNVCVLINKQKFFKYTPSIINSLNAYLLYKESPYTLKVYDINQSISSIENNCTDIIIYSLNKEYIKNLSNYKNIKFYIPTFNKNEIETNATNLFFGGIDYKNQITKLASFISDNKAVVINDNTHISNLLFKYENELNLTLITYNYPKIYYKDLNNSFLFLNTSASKTAQVLSKITYYNINTKLQLAPQINYDPILISITQTEDIKKIIIANSLLHIPIELEEFNLLLNSDIKYNWLNYASTLLLNKIYNIQTNAEEFDYLNDFNTYIFDNQIEYKTNLYQIINGGFKKVE